MKSGQVILILTLCSGFGTRKPLGAQWSGYGHDAQHTGDSPVASQPLNRIVWTTPVDTVLQGTSGELLVHYGTPVITEGDTVLVPQRTSVNNTYQINAFNGSTGAALYTLTTSYTPPPSQWTPSFGTALGLGSRYFYPGPGGTLLYRDTPDSATGNSGQLVFFGLANYQANQSTFNNNVQISTPITVDRFGNVYFGFMVSGTVTLPGGINLTSGLARITAAGVGSWVSAYTLGGGAASPIPISQVPLQCAPAVTASGTTLYIAVSNGGYSAGYLVAVNPATLTATARTRLTDPETHADAELPDISSAAPTIGPDGDVYYGVFETSCCSNHDRGWLLHFNSTLSTSRLPGAFGWDTTASIVAKNLVPSYTGPSTYLLLTKYNNYINTGGNGQNYVAITDPNVSMIDPVTGVAVMSLATGPGGTLMEQLGPTAASGGGVREWCINSAAIDPDTKSAIVNSEDGVNYRWDFTTNTLSQSIPLTGGVGEAYTPTVIGPDGMVYAINDGTLFAIGR